MVIFLNVLYVENREATGKIAQVSYTNTDIAYLIKNKSHLLDQTC